jgi:hypothetical protein
MRKLAVVIAAVGAVAWFHLTWPKNDVPPSASPSGIFDAPTRGETCEIYRQRIGDIEAIIRVIQAQDVGHYTQQRDRLIRVDRECREAFRGSP